MNRNWWFFCGWPIVAVFLIAMLYGCIPKVKAREAVSSGIDIYMNMTASDDGNENFFFRFRPPLNGPDVDVSFHASIVLSGTGEIIERIVPNEWTEYQPPGCECIERFGTAVLPPHAYLLTVELFPPGSTRYQLEVGEDSTDWEITITQGVQAFYRSRYALATPTPTHTPTLTQTPTGKPTPSPQATAIETRAGSLYLPLVQN